MSRRAADAVRGVAAFLREFTANRPPVHTELGDTGRHIAGWHVFSEEALLGAGRKP
jgi:hypothetical protein